MNSNQKIVQIIAENLIFLSLRHVLDPLVFSMYISATRGFNVEGDISLHLKEVFGEIAS